MRRAERDAGYSEYVGARQQALRRTAYALCGDWHRAEDLLQSALTKLYLAWPRLERRGAVDVYMRRVLLTTYLDERKRASSRREVPGLDGVEPADPSVTDGVLERDELVTALQRLPAMQRSVLVLRQLCDLSVEQTAADLGLSTGTVKSHHSRGLARLREVLEPTSDPEPDRAESRP